MEKTSDNIKFTDKQMKSFASFALLIKSINTRLEMEGYQFTKEGVVTPEGELIKYD